MNVVHCAYHLFMANRIKTLRAFSAFAGIFAVVSTTTMHTTHASARASARTSTKTSAQANTQIGTKAGIVAFVGPKSQVISPVDDLAARAGNQLKATTISVDGPEVSVNTERGTPLVFSASAGQTINVSSNRDWTLTGPLGNSLAGGSVNNPRIITLEDTGRYLLQLSAGVFTPASAKIATADPTRIVIPAAVGQEVSFDNNQVRRQVATVSVTGGQRYHLIVLPSGEETTYGVCVLDQNFGRSISIGCVTQDQYKESRTSFVTDHDGELTLQPQVTGRFLGSLRTRIEIAPNDVLSDPATNPVVDTEAKIGQSVVIPLWGTPIERAVISSPVVANVEKWGEPWIDKERTGSPSSPESATQRVFAVPVAFDPTKSPFISWTGRELQDGETVAVNRRRFGVYKGEDSATKIPTTGEPIVLKNNPWFASVGSLEFGEGERYAVQVTGTKIRPLSIAVRDPSGKFSSSVAPWQWTEDNGIQRAVTQITSNRPGRWAIELRPGGNAVSDISVAVAKLGSGGSYKGVIVVDDPLSIGEATDVNLSPNEFAQLTVKLDSPTPQIIQPEVLRYRSKTFQRTAVDMSLWDSRGRLVWSNNRNLEEEVLSGNNGKELLAADKQAVVSSTEPYRLIIDPHSDLAGRFRISVGSTPIVSDVPLGAGPIPRLPAGTKTGIVQLDKPTRFKVTGVGACVGVTSLGEWGGGKAVPVPVVVAPSAIGSGVAPAPFPVVASPGGQRCIRDGRTISLPVGVHRMNFNGPVVAGSTFTALAAGLPADPVVILPASIDGPAITIPTGQDPTSMVFSATAGTRVLLESDGEPASGTLQWPDGTTNNVGGVFAIPVTGTYTLWVSPGATSYPMRLRIAPAEVQNGKATLGAKSQAFNQVYGQRLEVAFSLSKATVVALESLSGPDASINFIYAADGFERRYFADGADGTYQYVQLPAGTFRFVFVGEGLSRVRFATTKQSKLRPVIIEGQ